MSNESPNINLPLLEVGNKKGREDLYYRGNIEPLNGTTKYAYICGMILLWILLFYCTGIPLLICSIMQQTNTLPLVPSPLINGSNTFTNEIFWVIMFPIKHHTFNYTFVNGSITSNGKFIYYYFYLFFI